MSCAPSLAVYGNNRASKILRRREAASAHLPVSKRVNHQCAHAKAIQPHKGNEMIKTQHCPNCEATEQKLHDFHQEVGDIVEAYVNATSVDDWEKLKTLIIPKPKPDPLVVLCGQLYLLQTHKYPVRLGT
jgi:hypothetical protein